jgi:hypothetical protein
MDRYLEYMLKNRLFQSGKLQKLQAELAPDNPYIFKAPEASQAPVLPLQGPQAQHSQPGTLESVQALRAQQAQHSQPSTIQSVQALRAQQAQHSQPGTLHAVQQPNQAVQQPNQAVQQPNQAVQQPARRAFYDPIRDNTRDSIFLFITSINIPLFVRSMVTNFISFFSTTIPLSIIIVPLLSIILFYFTSILEIMPFLIEHFGTCLTYLF